MYNMLGQFIEPGHSSEFVIMSFSASQLSIQDRWRNNSLSADFLADYWETFLLLQNPIGTSIAARLKNTVSYIANELLENAVKFHQNVPGFPIQLSLYQRDGYLRFYVVNSIPFSATAPFQEYLQALLAEDSNELYLQQIEQNANEEENTESHLGLLTLLNDYQVRLGWKFERPEQRPDTVVVTTMAELEIER